MKALTKTDGAKLGAREFDWLRGKENIYSFPFLKRKVKIDFERGISLFHASDELCALAERVENFY